MARRRFGFPVKDPLSEDGAFRRDQDIPGTAHHVLPLFRILGLPVGTNIPPLGSRRAPRAVRQIPRISG